LWKAEITGVDHSEKLASMKALGADHVIAYDQEDFTQNGQSYDLILEMVANRKLKAYSRSLNPDGKVVIVGGSPARLIGLMLGRTFLAEGKKVLILPHQPNTKDLYFLHPLIENGDIRIPIDRSYPLAELPSAMAFFGSGKVKGKVVLAHDHS